MSAAVVKIVRNEKPVSNDRIERALALLPAFLTQQDIFGARALLEEIYDAGQDDLMNDLCDTQDAARAWAVTPRRANAHITKLHEKYGIGRQLGGAWVLRRQDIEEHRPDQRFRPKR
jgi:hypothetical protein